MSRAMLPKSLADLGISFGDIVVAHNDWLRTGGASGTQAKFEGVDLGPIEWPGITLSAAKMLRVTMVRAKMPSGRFDMATFEGAMLAEVDFSSASLRGANLDKCTLDGANFRDAVFSPLPLAGMQGTKWPARMRGCRAQKADFRGADMTGVDMTEASLRDVDFRGANLTGAKLVDCDLAGADLRDTVMTDADLRGAMGVR
ncbi:MAG: pentapeptide repeat-containing protein [Rhodospirillales bacterium]